jgi:hypothetical protein
MLHLILLANLAFASALGEQEGAAQQTGITGQLTVRDGKSFLIRNGAEVRLTSAREEIAKTLADERLAGREFKLVGKALAGGDFDVSDFFVVRGGMLLRLVYFCATCNITTFAPGLCDCCREPTHPIEIPLNDPRVYHPGDRIPPGH